MPTNFETRRTIADIIEDILLLKYFDKEILRYSPEISMNDLKRFTVSNSILEDITNLLGYVPEIYYEQKEQLGSIWRVPEKCNDRRFVVQCKVSRRFSEVYYEYSITKGEDGVYWLEFFSHKYNELHSLMVPPVYLKETRDLRSFRVFLKNICRIVLTNKNKSKYLLKEDRKTTQIIEGIKKRKCIKKFNYRYE